MEGEVIIKGWRLRAYPTADQAAVLDRWSAAGGMLWNDLTAWWRNGTRQRFGVTRSLEAQKQWASTLGKVGAGANIYQRSLSAGVTLWEPPDWSPDVPVKMLHGVAQDFGQAVALWGRKQADRAALDTWRTRRLKRGLRPLPRWMFGAPRFIRVAERGSLRWQEQGEPLRRTSRRRGEVSVVGFKSAGLGKLEVALDAGSPDGRVKSLRLTRDQLGRWWLGMSIEVRAPSRRRAPHDAVGIDHGVAIAVATSHGPPLKKVSGLKPGEAARLKRLQRQEARAHLQMSPSCETRCSGKCGFWAPVFVREGGVPVRDALGQPVVAVNVDGVELRPSKRSLERRRQIAKLKDRERRRRQHDRHTFTRRLVDQYQLIGVEELQIKNMVASARGSTEAPGVGVAQKRGLSRSMSTQGWGEIDRQLRYKGAWAGRTVVAVPPQHTSQTCEVCGHCAPESRRSQAVFVCVNCGHTENADRNAARVVEQRARIEAAPERFGEEAVDRGNRGMKRQSTVRERTDR